MSGAKLYWLRQGSTYNVQQWNPVLAARPDFHPIPHEEALECIEKQNALNKERAANRAAGLETVNLAAQEEKRAKAKLVADGLIPPEALEEDAQSHKKGLTLASMDIGQLRDKASQMKILIPDEATLDEARGAVAKALELGGNMPTTPPPPAKRGPGRPRKSSVTAAPAVEPKGDE